MSARSTLLDALNDALVSVQRMPRRPAYRQRLLESVDLPGGLGGFRVLRAVEIHRGGAPSIGELAESLVVDPSTASRLVERCVAAGLLAREAQTGDRRRARLHLTSRGIARLERVGDSRRALFGQLTESWGDEDLQQFVRLLHRLLEGLDRLEGDS